MKLFNLLIAIIILQISLYAQSIVIDEGSTIYVPDSADICAGEYGNISGSLYGDGTQCGQFPVPVELSSFSAAKENNSVNLYWRTETEVNNRGFEILRSVSGDEWINLGFVEGNGSSTSPNEYSFTDENPSGGSKFEYKLKQLDFDGKFKYSEVVEIEIIPDRFALFQNYPNPFNPSTKIKYSVPQIAQVQIKIFDVLGNEIETLVNEEKPSGTYEVNWNAANLPSGIYFYELRAAEPSTGSGQVFIQTKKMLLLK